MARSFAASIIGGMTQMASRLASPIGGTPLGASCGDLIFGRFPDGGPSLEQVLGPAFAVIAALCPELGRAARAVLPMQANWRLFRWIGHDDYHLAAVHPGSFGNKASYLPSKALNLVCFGQHSAYFLGQGSGTMADWPARLRGAEAIRWAIAC